MSLNLNRITIAGNLTGKPELKTVGDQQVAKFSVAENRRWKNKAGEKQEETTYFDVDVWGKQAEHCAKYLDKGSGVYVEGRMACREYEKDGQKRKAWSIKADNVQFMGGKDDAKPKTMAASAGNDMNLDATPF